MTDYLASLDFDLTGLDLSGMTREEILSAMVEAALAGADRDDFDEPDAPFAWDESLHPRDERGRFTTSGGGMSASERASRRETAGKAARDFLTKTSPATKEELQALAGHLASLTVKQLHDLRREHGLQDPRFVKADFVTALHGYFEKVRREAAAKGADGRRAAVLKSAGAISAHHDGNIRDLAAIAAKHDTLDAAALEAERKGILDPAALATGQALRGERQGTSGADAYYRGVLEAAYKGGSKPAPAPVAEKPVKVTPAAPAAKPPPGLLADVLARHPGAARTGAMVRLGDLRKDLEGQYGGKEGFDRAVLDLARAGLVDLHEHDLPSSLSPAERARTVQSGGRTYIGLTVRESAPAAEKPVKVTPVVADPYAIRQEHSDWAGTTHRVGERGFTSRAEAEKHVAGLKANGMAPVPVGKPLFTRATGSGSRWEYAVQKAPEYRYPGGGIAREGYQVVARPAGSDGKWEPEHLGRLATPEEAVQKFVRSVSGSTEGTEFHDAGARETFRLHNAAREEGERQAEQARQAEAQAEHGFQTYRQESLDKARELKGRKQEITLSQGEKVSATVYGDLAVHKGEGGGYVITHVPTGFKVAGAHSQEEARAKVGALSHMDWSFTSHQHIPEATRKGSLAILGGWAGRRRPAGFSLDFMPAAQRPVCFIHGKFTPLEASA